MIDLMWSEKYRPTIITDMIGNEEARNSIVDWFKKWRPGTKPILLVGPPGIGKTTIANLAAKQFGYDMIGLNASDVRSKTRINEILNPVLGNVSVLGKPMIFIDEVDGIHGRADFGGAEALIKILKDPSVPIVLAANSDSSAKMKSIKKTAKTIYFRPLPPRLLRLFLENILRNENLELSPGSLIKVINESRGDIRSMINLAQTYISGFNPLTDKSFESLSLEFGINSFFKAKSIEEARLILYSIQSDPREKINAFYSSIITSKLSREETRETLEVLSKADLLYGHIMKSQQWRLMRYLNEILIKLYKQDSPVRYSQYNLSWPLLNRIRWDGRSIKALTTTLAKKMHVSKSIIATFYLPYILFCLKNKNLNLDAEDSFTEIIEKEIENT